MFFAVKVSSMYELHLSLLLNFILFSLLHICTDDISPIITQISSRHLKLITSDDSNVVLMLNINTAPMNTNMQLND